MNIKDKLYGSSLYVSLCGELDESSAIQTRNKMDYLIDTMAFDKVIFDLSELDFMDSTGIGVMIGRYKKLKARSIPCYITNPSAQAEKIFIMTGLYQIMPRID